MKTQPATTLPDCNEGPKAFQAFDAAMETLLAVPHSLLVLREQAYKKKRAKVPNRPGPKPKVKTSASRASHAKG